MTALSPELCLSFTAGSDVAATDVVGEPGSDALDDEDVDDIEVDLATLDDAFADDEDDSKDCCCC